MLLQEGPQPLWPTPLSRQGTDKGDAGWALVTPCRLLVRLGMGGWRLGGRGLGSTLLPRPQDSQSGPFPVAAYQGVTQRRGQNRPGPAHPPHPKDSLWQAGCLEGPPVSSTGAPGASLPSPTPSPQPVAGTPSTGPRPQRPAHTSNPRHRNRSQPPNWFRDPGRSLTMDHSPGPGPRARPAALAPMLWWAHFPLQPSRLSPRASARERTHTGPGLLPNPCPARPTKLLHSSRLLLWLSRAALGWGRGHQGLWASRAQEQPRPRLTDTVSWLRYPERLPEP